MAPPTFRSPYPQLLLPEASGSELRRLAQGLVADAVDEYEHFLWRQHGTVTQPHWSLVRDKHDVRVYQDKRADKPHKMQELLAVGTLPGELDDALYGAVSTTTDALRLRAAYTNERVANSAVLATIQRPSRAKPFRSLTVQWRVSGLPLHARALAAKKSDMVVLDCTGTKTLSNGETVGFQLVHSVDLAQTPPLPPYDRANLSLCTIYRQTTDDRVQLYARAFVGASDKARSARTTADALLAGARVVHCAHMKKLAWLMRCKAAVLGDRVATSRSLTGRRDVGDSGVRSSSGADQSCEICPSQHLQGGRRSAKASCAVCTRLVCASCRVKRELCAIASDRRLLEQRVSFCLPCHSIATRATAADVAVDDAAHAHAERPFAGAHGGSLVFEPGVLHDDEDDSNESDDDAEPREAGGVEVLGNREDEPYRHRFSFAKSTQRSSLGGTLEDSEMDWSPAARHRAGAELHSLFILGDA